MRPRPPPPAEDTFVFPQVVVRDRVYEKCLNALEQVKSRKGQPILICEENDEKTISFVPAHGQYIEVSRHSAAASID